MNFFRRFLASLKRTPPQSQEDIEAADEGARIREKMATTRVGERWLTGQGTQPERGTGTRH
jgi:hypothetical protein